MWKNNDRNLPKITTGEKKPTDLFGNLSYKQYFCKDFKIYHMMLRKGFIWTMITIAVLLLVALTGGSFYMLEYSLASDPNRSDEDSMYTMLFANYPDTEEWVDSLRRHKALRDTTLLMEDGYHCHAYYIEKGSNKTALVVHGWRDQAIKFFYLAKMYERDLGYNVVIPEIYGHGKSDGDVARMGWLDRLDMLQWLKAFRCDTMVMHGVSMGAATTMMTAGEKMPEGIKDIRFVEDCGYTSVWDEFSGQLSEQFSLPEFPLLYSSSLLCQLLYDWNFSEASAIEQIKKVKQPMLLIHGESDSFVPTEMVYRLYDAKPDPKELWVAKGSEHARSYKDHPEEYTQRVRQFLNR